MRCASLKQRCIRIVSRRGSGSRGLYNREHAQRPTRSSEYYEISNFPAASYYGGFYVFGATVSHSHVEWMRVPYIESAQGVVRGVNRDFAGRAGKCFVFGGCAASELYLNRHMFFPFVPGFLSA